MASTLKVNTIQEYDGNDITLDASGDIALSADGGNVKMDDGTTTVFDFDVDGVNLKIMDDADTGDYFNIAVGAAGATTLTTVDDDGATANLQITADGTAELAGTTVTLDSAGDVTLDANGDNISFKAGGTNPLDFANSSGQWTINNGTDAKDIIFTQYDDDVVARVHDGGTATTIETGTLDLTVGAAGKGGFGFKRPVYKYTSTADDDEIVLRAEHTGALIQVIGSGPFHMGAES